MTKKYFLNNCIHHNNVTDKTDGNKILYRATAQTADNLNNYQYVIKLYNITNNNEIPTN